MGGGESSDILETIRRSAVEKYSEPKQKYGEVKRTDVEFVLAKASLIGVIETFAQCQGRIAQIGGCMGGWI